MAEMKSLTLGGTKYDSFVDQTAREGLSGKQDAGAYVKTVNGAAPDASGNVTVEAGGGGGGGGGALELLFEVTTTDPVLKIETGIDLNQYNEIVAYCVSVASDGATNTHFDWGVSTHGANTEMRVDKGLHGSQMRCFPLRLIRTADGVMDAITGYGYWGGDSAVCSNEVKHFLYDKEVTDNFYCMAYAYGNTMLAAGTILKVYGR